MSRKRSTHPASPAGSPRRVSRRTALWLLMSTMGGASVCRVQRERSAVSNIERANARSGRANGYGHGIRLSNWRFDSDARLGTLDSSARPRNRDSRNPAAPVANIEDYQDPEYQQLAAMAASEPDADKRKQTYARINRILLDQSFIMPLGGVPVRLASRANVQDVRPLLHDTFAYDGVWLQ